MTRLVKILIVPLLMIIATTLTAVKGCFFVGHDMSLTWDNWTLESSLLLMHPKGTQIVRPQLKVLDSDGRPLAADELEVFREVIGGNDGRFHLEPVPSAQAFTAKMMDGRTAYKPKKPDCTKT